MTNIDQQLQHEIIETMNVELLPEVSLSIFKEKLAGYINDLINQNIKKLINILYRLDVSEKKLREALASSSKDSGELITELIIERQMQKIKVRGQYYQKNKKDISDEEKW